MIKALLFDFDGVLTVEKTGSASITKYISKACGLPWDLVKAAYSPYNKALLMGELTHRDMWSRFCEDLGKQIDCKILTEAFQHTVLDANMIDLVKKLKESCYMALVTDNKWDRIDTILRTHHLEPYFDVVAVSARLHTGKDTGDIFQYVLRKL